MLRIENLRTPPGSGTEGLRAAASRALGVRPEALGRVWLLRRSVDARDGVALICTVAAEVKGESAVLKRCRGRKVRGTGAVTRWEPPEPYRLPPMMPPPEIRPVIVGAGPGGLFAALVLGRAGQRPILLERGRKVEERRADVERFWATGELDLESNVQFGEGGAGAFSDGKLNTGTKDPRHRFILEQLVSCGAPEDILIDAKPHVGTDYLYVLLQDFRRKLLELGVEIRFQNRLTDLELSAGCLEAVAVENSDGPYRIPCRRLILCPGHSARDVFAMLERRGVPMESKPFAVGVRIEHLQADCDAAQYRQYAGHPGLPASSYKLSCHLGNGRGVFSFCVCPGGEVVAAASEAGRAVTNGMSAYARDGENINGGLLVGVTPEDFGGGGPLAGVTFQRRLEEAAYALGGGGYLAPAQRVEDFLARRPSVGPGKVKPTYRPGVTWGNLWDCLPEFIAGSLAEALPILGRKLKGFDDPDAVLTAVESRSSSPVRILRDEGCQSAVRGLYPCGEGTGYAGGILSAAADGMRCAEAVLRDCEDEGGEQE